MTLEALDIEQRNSERRITKIEENLEKMSDIIVKLGEKLAEHRLETSVTTTELKVKVALAGAASGTIFGALAAGVVRLWIK